MSRLFIILVLFCVTPAIYGQDAILEQTKSSNIQVIQDYRIPKLIQKETAINEKKKSMPGYRVQLYFGNQRKPATDVKAKFLSSFSTVPAYEIYQSPNFKIRVGDFRTKLEAYKLLKQIATEFPNAFIVADDISLPDIE